MPNWFCNTHLSSRTQWTLVISNYYVAMIMTLDNWHIRAGCSYIQSATRAEDIELCKLLIATGWTDEQFLIYSRFWYIVGMLMSIDNLWILFYSTIFLNSQSSLAFSIYSHSLVPFPNLFYSEKFASTCLKYEPCCFLPFHWMKVNCV